MLTATLDTHDLIKELKQVGFDERQAEAQVHTAKLIADAAINHLKEEAKGQEPATKYELKQLENDLRFEIKQVETSLTTKIDKVQASMQIEIEKNKNSILLWSFSMFITQTSLLLGLFGKVLNFY